MGPAPSPTTLKGPLGGVGQWLLMGHRSDIFRTDLSLSTRLRRLLQGFRFIICKFVGEIKHELCCSLQVLGDSLDVQVSRFGAA